jgi:hypothetical protein
MIDKHGQTERVAEPYGGVDDRIVKGPQGLLQPAENVLA